MTNYERIEQLRAYALTARASIYNEDAMTSIQLAGCTAKKVNEVVDLVNGLLDLVETIMREGDLLPNEYIESSETLKV